MEPLQALPGVPDNFLKRRAEGLAGDLLSLKSRCRLLEGPSKLYPGSELMSSVPVGFGVSALRTTEPAGVRTSSSDLHFV